MNITLRISDELGKRAKHFAVDEGKSLSAVVEELLEQRLGRIDSAEYLNANQAAWALMDEGISGGGEKFVREDVYRR